MRIAAANINEALELLEAEFANLKEVSDCEDAGELHGSAGLYDDEAEAFQLLESAIEYVKAVYDLT